MTEKLTILYTLWSLYSNPIRWSAIFESLRPLSFFVAVSHLYLIPV